MRRSIPLLHILAIFVASLIVGLPHLGGALTPPMTYPLLQQSDLVYQGAFRLPNDGSVGNSTFSYGGFSPAYNPTKKSLFLVGHDQQQQVAEVTIPTIINSTQISALATAAVLQPFAEASEGKMFTVDPTPNDAMKLGGLMVYGGQLHFTVYSYYDAQGDQVVSHFSRPLNLSMPGAVHGPYQVGTRGAGLVAGWLMHIPPEWQSAFGGPALTGQCCIPITSRTSYGPAAFVFDPAALGVTQPVPATPLVYYTQAHQNSGAWDSGWNPSQGNVYNGNTLLKGVIFPGGTRSILFVGAQGTRPTWCYGAPTSDPSLDGKLTSDRVTVYCYDPVHVDGKGPHGWPYVAEVWAYDANDLLAVKNGQRQPWDVKPYAVWTLSLPFGDFGATGIGGAGYDPQTGRIFLSQLLVDHLGCCDFLPVIHVFTVKSLTNVSFSAPTNLRVVP